MVTISEVTEVDDELVSAFERLIPQLSSSNPPPSAGTLGAIVGSQASTLLIARDDDGTILGSLTLAMFRIPTGLRAWIEDVVVDDAARGKGVGQLLNERALEIARGGRRDHRRPHLAAHARGGQPSLSAHRLRGTRDERLPLSVLVADRPRHTSRSAAWRDPRTTAALRGARCARCREPGARRPATSGPVGLVRLGSVRALVASGGVSGVRGVFMVLLE